jgi:hypothetical protein
MAKNVIQILVIVMQIIIVFIPWDTISEISLQKDA